MKWTWRDTCATGIIILVVGSFFFRLFWPTPQLIVTPDFGVSDAWNLSFTTKYFLGANLHAHELPLWSATVGDGFPVYAEGQIGTFFPPNLIFFSLGNPVTAYNLALLTSVLTAAIGLYVWLKILGLSRGVSIIHAVTFGLSGVVVAHLTHITLLQSFTLMPIIMAATHLAATHPTWRNHAGLSTLIAFQLCTGFPQGVLITLCFSMPYFIFLIWKQEQKLLHIIYFCATLIFALFLGAIQLLPSYEFLKQIASTDGFSVFGATQYSFPFSHLLTFLNPFALGNPKLATYAFPDPGTGSIFWENSGYIGIVPFFFIPFAFARNNRKRGLAIFFAIVIFASFLLMLGRNSPLYILFSFWPFNLFRVPSRFIWIFVLSLLVLSAYGVTRILRFIRKPLYHYIVIAIPLLTQIIMLSTVWWNYHQMALPVVHHEISNEKTYGIGLTTMYADRFIHTGWQDMKPYDFVQTTLMPNANFLTGIKSHEVYAGRQLRRSALLDSILLAQIQQDAQIATVSADGQKILDIMGITTIFSSTPIIDTGLHLTETRSQKPFSVNVYTNKTAVSRIYLTSSVVTATTKEDAQKQFFDDSFVPGNTVLLETDLPIDKPTNEGKVTIIEHTDTTVSVRVTDHPAKNILVLGDTYYPGWEAKIDNIPTHIYPANVTYRAVLVPAGDHIITFSYKPKTFILGAWISSISLGITIFLMVFGFVYSRRHTHQKASLRAPYRRGNRDRSLPHNR